MTIRELKIAALSASIAAFLGIGATHTVQGASAPSVNNATLRIFNVNAKGDAGEDTKALAFEICAQAIVPGNDAGTDETVTEQGCESALVPPAMAAKVDTLMTAAVSYWKTKRGVP